MARAETNTHRIGLANADRPRVEWLIDSLDHENPEIRAIASRDLARESAQDFGYRVNMPGDQRRAIQERYRLWWSTQNEPDP